MKCDILDAIKVIIDFIGDDSSRVNLADTPKKMSTYLLNVFSGYKEDPKEILKCNYTNDAQYYEPIWFENIEFTSYCEHHMLEFLGTVKIGYIPKTQIIGFSRIIQLVHCLAKRLQTQERLTQEIADSLGKYIDNDGISVLIEAKHKCTSYNQQSKNVIVKTSISTGKFKHYNV